MDLMLMRRFRDRLEAEFQARRAKNARYSLRAFARFLHGEHSTLSQILRGSRRRFPSPTSPGPLEPVNPDSA
jgi:hypothetical protein